MVLTSAELTAFVGAFLWPFMRIGSMFLAAPFFGTRSVPVRIRVLLAAVITVMVIPLLPAPPPVEPFSLPGLVISLQQVLIGLTTGFILQLAFSALVIAGESIAMTMGLGFASMVDPQNGVNVPVISQFFLITGMLLFLALGGHLLLIQLVIESFRSLPIGPQGIERDGLWAVVAWGSRMFVGAALIALPAVASLLVVNIAMGVMTRAAPQLNLFSVGFPVTMLLGFVLLALLLPSIMPRFAQLVFDSLAFGRDLTGR